MSTGDNMLRELFPELKSTLFPPCCRVVWVGQRKAECPKKNPGMHGENRQTAHTKDPSGLRTRKVLL